ncbi:alpha/beta hydrolase-fold protein [Olsenella phocaeensis]|uniref:alpha/beta hydrolase-fold protein n=1 Tax=Olsenella phocaeensis TaxID=1852385 RepID=UPI0009313BB2|nr:alpha/beta hydrolase-fold protein [Olsenella phocaeensis]
MAIDARACETFVGSLGADAPVVYLVDAPEFPHGVAELAAGRRVTLVGVPIANWDDALTPWPAPGLREGDAGFGGGGPATVGELLGEVVPGVEARASLSPTKRAICGYSLGGLFALYAMLVGVGAGGDAGGGVSARASLGACACVSGSLWYEGWVDWLRGQAAEGRGRMAYLSLGSKERRWGPPAVRRVQECMEESAELLRGWGFEVDLRMGPGNHLQHQAERLGLALDVLEEFLLR